MDTILEMTRERAFELQNDQRFRAQLAESAADQDEALQALSESLVSSGSR